MKLLIVTQKIDMDDDILGVYHEWAREISKSFDKLSVICLYEGRNELPEDIRVFSLGKEKNADSRGFGSGFARMQYLKNFFFYIWTTRKDYNAVFVHMNPVYVLIGWPLWVLMRKKVFLFYAHYRAGPMLRVASVFCRKILTSVPGSCGLKSPKVLAIGQGIDVSRFSPKRDANARERNSILFVGRISPVKNLDVLIDAFYKLSNERKITRLIIVGGKDYNEEEYFNLITQKIKSLNLERNVIFLGKVPNRNMPEVYSSYEICVNLTKSGSFDKAILEAMSCECLPIVCNRSYESIFQGDFCDSLLFSEGDASDLSQKIKKIMTLSQEEKGHIRKNLRDIVVNNHSLFTLGGRLRKVMSM